MRPSGSILRFSDTMSDDITLPLDDAELDELNELLASRSGLAELADPRAQLGLVRLVALGASAVLQRHGHVGAQLPRPRAGTYAEAHSAERATGLGAEARCLEAIPGPAGRVPADWESQLNE